MNKKILVLGSSLLGFALCVAVAKAEAADDAAAAADAPAAEEEAAPQRGFYVGGSVGGSFFEGASLGSRIFSHETGDTNGDGRSDAFTPDSIGEDSNVLWSAFVGYRLADWLGAEVGWTDLGGFSATDIDQPGDGTPSHNDSVSVNVDGIEARLRGWVPLGTDRVSGIGGIGIFIFSSHAPKFCNGPNTSACTKGPGHYDRVPPALDPRNDSGQALTLSAGLQFKVTDNVLIRTEYQHYFEVLDQGVDTVMASVVIGFYDFFGQASGGDSFGGITVE